MKVAVFDTHRFEREFLTAANKGRGHELLLLEPRLTEQTAQLAQGCDAVCAFVNDKLGRATLTALKALGVRLVALRSAGFNHVDLTAADELGLTVVRVPEYSPYAVAEHAVCLILALNRKIHRAYARVREANFSLDGLVGFDLHGKTVGVIGTGKIGTVFTRIMRGFGCRVVAFDHYPNAKLAGELGFEYVPLEKLYADADIISLHVPLTPETRHMIDERAFSAMKPGIMLINTGRGGLIDTHALIDALKTCHVGAAGLDVYEEEEGVFFQDLSDTGVRDDQLARLLTFPNVVVTSHQAFLTREALGNIAATTLQNMSDFAAGKPLPNEVCVQKHVAS